MARDRMCEFLLLSPHHKRSIAPSGGDSGAGSSSSSSSSSLMPINDETRPFFVALVDVQRMVGALEALHVAQLVDGRAETRERMRDTVGNIRAECHHSREIIDEYGSTTQRLAQRGSEGTTSCLSMAELRMRENIMLFMEYQLLMMVRTVWVLQRTYEERLIDATTRRLTMRIALGMGGFSDCSNAEASAEAAAAAAAREAHTREIARHLVVSGSESQLFSLSCKELERVMYTRNAVLDVEREMQGLLQLFTDLHFLVNEQHERLVTVQKNIGTSSYNIEAGMRHLREARQYKKNCCSIQ